MRTGVLYLAADVFILAAKRGGYFWIAYDVSRRRYAAYTRKPNGASVRIGPYPKGVLMERLAEDVRVARDALKDSIGYQFKKRRCEISGKTYNTVRKAYTEAVRRGCGLTESSFISRYRYAKMRLSGAPLKWSHLVKRPSQHFYEPLPPSKKGRNA